MCCCLFVWEKRQKGEEGEKKRFSLLGQSSFLNTFGVFFSSGSAAISPFLSLSLTCAPSTPTPTPLPPHFVDDAVTALGILDAFQSLPRQKRGGTIYLFLRQTNTNIHIHIHIHTHTHSFKSCSFLPPLLFSSMCGLGGLSVLK